VLDSTYDFSSWLEGISQISGLAATHAEPDANHSWHFLRSDLANKFVPRAAGAVEYSNEEWKDLAPDPRDAILVVKQYLHHTAFSQPPLLAMPQSVAASLREETLKPHALNVLGDRLLKEYRKTAVTIAAQPWNLLKGQMYLEKLCDDNEKGIVLPPPKLNCLFHYKMPALNLHPEVEAAEPSAPRKIFVAKPEPSRKRKSPGEAKAKAKGKAKAKAKVKARVKARADARPAEPDADADAAAAAAAAAGADGRPADGARADGRPADADADAARADGRPADAEPDADADAAAAAGADGRPADGARADGRPADADADAARADGRPADAEPDADGDADAADAAAAPGQVLRRPAAAAAPGQVLRRPAAAAAVPGPNGCPKCRFTTYGCTQCQARARLGHLGYYFGGPDGKEVLCRNR